MIVLMLAMLAKLKINRMSLKYINEKKNKQTKKQRHLVIHLVTGAINTNSLWQKEKRKRSAQNVYRSFFLSFQQFDRNGVWLG